jgi:hypothetical protein
MPSMNKNPLDSTEADFNVDLKQLAGYTLKDNNTFIDSSKEKVQISEKAMNLIN